MDGSSTFSNDTILEQLRSGSAQFELVSQFKPLNLLQNNAHHCFFARVGPPLGGTSSSNIKVEHYSVQKVTGDGRCMFRALVKGMARNKGIPLTPQQEGVDADELRAAVKEVICENEKERSQYQDAVVAITVDEPLQRYCRRIGRSEFWGGESELLLSLQAISSHSMANFLNSSEKFHYSIDGRLEVRWPPRVLSKLCKQPIIVYIPQSEWSN